MSGFVQVIEYTTTRFDEVRALGDKIAAETTGRGAARRVLVTADRDRPNTYQTLVEFESYDAAMENSARPETQQFAEQMAKLCDGPPRFLNLDVVAVHDVG